MGLSLTKRLLKRALFCVRRNVSIAQALDVRPLCGLGLKFYQFINYDQIYGTGSVLCYRVEPCVRMLAIQGTCGFSCCRDGAEGDDAFEYAAANHNYRSNNGPGPWVVAILDQFESDGTVNYGAGEADIYPCPLRPTERDVVQRNQRSPPESRWRSPSFTCNPLLCSSAPAYPSHQYGCYRCDEVSRVGYVIAQETANPAHHLQLYVNDTKQRWGDAALAFATRTDAPVVPTDRLSRPAAAHTQACACMRVRACVCRCVLVCVCVLVRACAYLVCVFVRRDKLVRRVLLLVDDLRAPAGALTAAAST